MQKFHSGYNYFLLNPIVIYLGINNLYFIPSYVSGFIFTDIPFLFLSKEAKDPEILQKGLYSMIVANFFFILGYIVYRKIFTSNRLKTNIFLSGNIILILAFLGVIVGILIYEPSRYFFADYALSETDDIRWTIGNNIVYFCGEILVALGLSVIFINGGKLKPLNIIIVFFTIFLLLFRLKRLEMIIPILSTIAIYICRNKISIFKIISVFLLLIVAISLIGGLRFGLENYDPIMTVLSIVLEANYTCNSFYSTIYLIDFQGYSYAYGKDFLIIPIQIIPTFILPFKQNIVNSLVNKNWSNGYVLNPLGAFFGMANVYRQGGIIVVAIFNFILGIGFKNLFITFKESLQNDRKSFILYSYPIILYSFTFHFVRDDINVAFKMIIQIFFVFYLFKKLSKITVKI